MSGIQPGTCPTCGFVEATDGPPIGVDVVRMRHLQHMTCVLEERLAKAASDADRRRSPWDVVSEKLRKLGNDAEDLA